MIRRFRFWLANRIEGRSPDCRCHIEFVHPERRQLTPEDLRAEQRARRW